MKPALRLPLGFAALALLALSPVANAASLGGPGFYNGSGGVDSNFTVVQQNDVQIGLRGALRQNPADALLVGNTYFVPTGAQTNVTSGGNGANASRAAWSWDWSINTQPGNGTTTSNGGLTLADIHSVITVSDALGHSFSGAFTGPLDSATWGAAGESVLALSTLSSTWGVQNSSNATFADFPLKGDPTFLYNMNDPNTFKFTLDVYNTGNSLLASDTIYVNVSENPAAAAAAVPVPAAVWGGSVLLGLLGGARTLKRFRRAD